MSNKTCTNRARLTIAKAGNSDNVTSNQVNGTGIGTQAFKERHEDQKPGEPSAIGKVWNQSQYGNDKGK